MANFGMPGFVPRYAGKVIFGLKIFKPNVPDERAEGFDGIDFVALGADKTKADVFVGVFWKTSFAIGCIVVAGVFEGVEARIAERDRAALKRFGFATEWRWFFGALSAGRRGLHDQRSEQSERGVRVRALVPGHVHGVRRYAKWRQHHAQRERSAQRADHTLRYGGDEIGFCNHCGTPLSFDLIDRAI